MSDPFAVRELRIRQPARVLPGRARYDIFDSGRTLLKRGQIADAVVQLQSAVDADPNYADAHSALADALDRQGRSADAALERQKAQKLIEAARNPGDVAPAHP